MAASEYVLIDSNSNQLLYIGRATLTRTTATSPSRGTKGQKLLGFCHSKDFAAITKRIEKTLNLEKLYGDKWWEYDDRE